MHVINILLMFLPMIILESFKLFPWCVSGGWVIGAFWCNSLVHRRESFSWRLNLLRKKFWYFCKALYLFCGIYRQANFSKLNPFARNGKHETYLESDHVEQPLSTKVATKGFDQRNSSVIGKLSTLVYILF